VAISGASGTGQEWYYDPHVHVSLWERRGLPGWDTIDFELYAGADPIELEDDMIAISSPGRGVAVIGAGYFVSLTPEEAANVGAIVTASVSGNDRQFDLWRSLASRGDSNWAPVVNALDPPASDPAKSLVTPVWVAGFFLGLIGLVEVVRFVVDLVV
jgi:hypothetical protein